MGRTLIPILTILAAIAAACNSTGCLDNGSAIPLAGFYSSATGGAVSVDSLEIYGVGAPADSAVLTPASHASQVYLPMRADKKLTQWVIACRTRVLDTPALYDTLSLAYEAIPYFASEECGAMYCYRVSEITCTGHLIDSVQLTNSLITNVDIESIKIYFRTATQEEAPQ